MADQQSGRISATFRAAKPLLPLKRPYNDYKIKSACDVDSPARGFVTKRVPLSEASLNTRHNAIGNEYYCGPSSSDVIESCLSERAIIDTVVSAGKENLCRSYFETPRKELECDKPLDCFSVTGLLDDDFDESVFEEIDVLVQQKSTAMLATIILAYKIE